MTRLGFVINLETCCDLRNCMGACKREHQSFLGSHFVDVRTNMDESFPDPNTYFVPVLCQHCSNPACLRACRHGALTKREDGIVLVSDAGVCESCEDKQCAKACPYGAIDVDPETGRIGKCTLCVDRIEAGRLPACASECMSKSWYFGDFDDPGSLVSQIVRDWGVHAHQLNPDAGTQPNVYYLLHTKRWDDMRSLYSPAWRNMQGE